jgi:prolyl oligopeptidase
VLVDPEIDTQRTGVPHAINYFRPSWDGLHLAYGMSAGGSEQASMYLMHLPSGRLLGKPVPRVYDAGLNWLPDSRSFTYTQMAVLKPGQSEIETYMDARVMWLRLGQPRSRCRSSAPR